MLDSASPSTGRRAGYRTSRPLELRDAEIRALGKKGYHRVSQRLYVQVTIGVVGTIKRSWIFKYKFAGKSAELGLGPYPTISLRAATLSRDRLSILLAEGKDPKTERSRNASEYKATIIAERTKRANTFRSCAERLHSIKRPEWKNAKHAQQWISSLETYAYPLLGNMSVQDVRSQHVIASLEPIWQTKTETAWRTRDRIFKVLEWAQLQGYRSADEALELRVREALPDAKKLVSQKKQHHVSLPYRDVAQFIGRFNETECPAIVKLLHEFTILNGNRSGEARGALWSEIDLAQGRWVIGRERMKGGSEHRIPLSKRSLAILREAADLGTPGCHLVFPSPLTEKPISDNTLCQRFRQMGYLHTVHGYRSSMRDWAAEQTTYAWEVMEKALAHKVGTETEAAYFRSDLLEKRAAMMEDWSLWCTRK